MHSRVGRIMLAALLVAVGIGAALQLNFLLGQTRQLTDEYRAVSGALDRFDTLAADLTAAQSAYVAPGQPDAPWLERSSTLQSQLAGTVASIRSHAKSDAAPTAVQTISEALSRLAEADANARAHLQHDEDLLAADVVFSEARDAVNAARDSATGLVKAETESFESARTAVDSRMIQIAGGAAAIWIVGLLILIPRPGQPDNTISIAVEPSRRAAVPTEPSITTAAGAVDLNAAAELCAALSRVASPAALPDMLARAAALLDATGVIVWIGHDDALFAVTSHGYNPRVIRQLGAIDRDSDNATAAAWRTGELRTVPSDAMANGAIVAPMFGPEGCIGVLAAEVRHGREQDASTRAVTTMIAAQLATIIAATPPVPQTRAAEG